jgi:hypothetical protein
MHGAADAISVQTPATLCIIGKDVASSLKGTLGSVSISFTQQTLVEGTCLKEGYIKYVPFVLAKCVHEPMIAGCAGFLYGRDAETIRSFAGKFASSVALYPLLVENGRLTNCEQYLQYLMAEATHCTSPGESDAEHDAIRIDVRWFCGLPTEIKPFKILPDLQHCPTVQDPDVDPWYCTHVVPLHTLCIERSS